MRPIKMKTLIVNRNTPDLALNQKRQVELMSERVPSLDNEVIIYNCEEEPFEGKLSGHSRALQQHYDRECDYYWFSHPDLSFAIDMDCLLKLVTFMERNPWIAVISPTESKGTYINMLERGYRWHPVAVCDYLSLMIRRSVIDKIGFMNPDFRYSWGAIHEYSYKAYGEGWCVAYCDLAKMHHFGGTTYGRKGMVSRDAYIRHAKAFARSYFVEHYGKSWDKEFARFLPGGVTNTYAKHRKHWERGDIRTVIFNILNYIGEFVREHVGGAGTLRLQLGLEERRKRGWVVIGADKEAKPDIVADANDLNMFEDDSVSEIEGHQVLEHAANTDFTSALDEWHRVLKTGGKLSLVLDETLADELTKRQFGEVKRWHTTQVGRAHTKFVSLTCVK